MDLLGQGSCQFTQMVIMTDGYGWVSSQSNPSDLIYKTGVGRVEGGMRCFLGSLLWIHFESEK